MPAFAATSAIQEIMRGIHRPEAHASDPVIAADDYKLALYADGANLTAATSVYQTANEVTGTGYTAGGVAITIRTAAVTVSGKSGYGYTFNDVEFTGNPLNFSFRYAMVYRDEGTIKRVLFIVDHGSGNVQTVSGNSAIYAPPTGANMLPVMITPA